MRVRFQKIAEYNLRLTFLISLLRDEESESHTLLRFILL